MELIRIDHIYWPKVYLQQVIHVPPSCHTTQNKGVPEMGTHQILVGGFKHFIFSIMYGIIINMLLNMAIYSGFTHL